MNSLTVTSKFAAALFAAGLSFGFPATSFADIDTLICGSACSWSIAVDGKEEAAGTYSVDPVTGEIEFAGEPIDLGGGVVVQIKSLSGNVDPLLGFSTSASTGAASKSFAFAFSTPLAYPDPAPINAFSSVGYSLTAKTTAGAQIQPFLQTKVLDAADVDTSIGGVGDLDKDVDAGDTFFILPFTGPPNFKTAQSQTFTNTNSFFAGSAYELMSVRLSFSLTPNTEVGITGAVEQILVPEPSTYGMLAAGLLVLGFIARRRLH